MGNKSLARNSVYNVAYKLLNVLFPLVTSTYLGHVLLASGVGRVTYAQNIVLYFTTLATLGIPNYGIREVAKRRGDGAGVNTLFTELFSINAISTTICCAAFYTMIAAIPYFNRSFALYALAGIAIPLTYFSIDWLYQGLEEYGYIAARSAVIKVISLVCILAFIKSPDDIELYALIYCAAIGGNNILNLLNLRRMGISFDFRAIGLKRHLKPIFILFASVIAIELYTMLDTTMIGAMCAEVNVGYYADSMKLVKVLISAITAIAAVLLPRLSYYYGNGMIDECSRLVSRMFHILLLIFLPCAAGVFLLAPQIMPLLFGESFIPAVPTLRIASLLICVIGFSNLFGTQVLLTFSAEKKLLICTLIGAGTNILMNAALIPRFAQNGAAVASVISELLVTGFSVYFARRYIRLDINPRIVLSSVAATAAMAAAVLLAGRAVHGEWAKLFVSIPVGVAVYALANLCVRNPILAEVKPYAAKFARKIRRK